MKKVEREIYIFFTRKREKKRLKKGKRKKHVSSARPLEEIKNITIPPILDLNENRDKLIGLLKNIQDGLLNKKRFRIDHQDMASITMEALLMLVSEIERCTTISNIKLKGNYKLFPKSKEINDLLCKIGYWDYFNIPSKKRNKKTENSQSYLKIIGDTKISGEKIGSLILFFENLICFDSSTKDKFSDALMEAAANAVEHAYSSPQEIKSINKWWLTASLNKDTNEISFIFYDQGLGILNTLESGQGHIKLKRLVAGWINEGASKGGILRKLITTNLSSYKDERRGNGLISFKTFIDDVEGGELSIHTENVSYSAISDSIQQYHTNISGTLIAWKIKANHNTDKCMYIKR